MNTPATRTLALPGEAASEALGAALAASLPAARQATDSALVLALAGDLGAGKTTVARALLRALGETGPVRSPSYTLLEPYELEGWRVRHLDLYRLGDPAEVMALGLRDELQPGTLLLVEWPERGAGQLPPADLWLRLAEAERGAAREARLEARTPAGLAWMAALPWPQ
jgi:tRNA threonylcarbamoyladenosine biosynthesis protein TsaE